MKLRGLHIILAAALLLCLSACGKKDKIIPRSTLEDLYVDLFLADQWLIETPGQSRIADTTMVYEPIFNKYGYTTLDYIASVNHYIRDPKRYARILKRADAKLVARLNVLQALVDEETALKEQLELLAGFDPGLKLYFDTVYMRVTKEAGLRFELDSFGRYMPVLPPAPDSLLFLDSLALADSLARLDSIAGLDSLALRDSLAPEVELLPLRHDGMKLEKEVAGVEVIEESR